MAKKTILVVDDEADFVDVLRLRLEAIGYRVVAAYNGEEGIEKALREGPDLILLDLVLPKMNGFTALSKLKLDPITAEIPVIILTAKSETEFMEGAAKLGAIEYIIKPATLEMVVELVRKHLK